MLQLSIKFYEIFPIFLHFKAKLGMTKDLGKWTKVDSCQKPRENVSSIKLKYLID